MQNIIDGIIINIISNIIWVLILGILCFFGFKFGIPYIEKFKKKFNRFMTSDIYDYNNDEIKGVKWRFYWEYNKYQDVYFIKNLIPLCPKCLNELDETNEIPTKDGRFVVGYQPIGLKCTKDNCDFGTIQTEDVGILYREVEKEIRRKVNSGEYRD